MPATRLGCGGAAYCGRGAGPGMMTGYRPTAVARMAVRMACATGALVALACAAAAQVAPAQAPQAPQAQAPQGQVQPPVQPDPGQALAPGNKPGFIDAF